MTSSCSSLPDTREIRVVPGDPYQERTVVSGLLLGVLSISASMMLICRHCLRFRVSPQEGLEFLWCSGSLSSDGLMVMVWLAPLGSMLQ